MSTEGCRRLKASGRAQKCFIYHNMEVNRCLHQPPAAGFIIPLPFQLALEWEESQRAVMYDPQRADFFLQYTDGHGNKNGTIYNEGIEFGDQFFWDYRCMHS